jgi:hypothetical protein
MTIKHRFVLFLIFVITFLSLSCKEKAGKYINQGEIYYSLYFSEYSGPVPEAFMPKNLVVSFKKDKILFEILSPYGDSGLRILSNPETGILETYLSMAKFKYYYTATDGESLPGFEGMDGMEINKTSKTSVICGFNCKNAEVTFPADRHKIYSIWFTDEINIKSPNASTPFSEIDGVLMSFFFIVGKSEMHFYAESVFKKEVSNKTFERQPNFERITKEDFNKVIEEMIGL